LIVGEHAESFIVKDATGQALGYFLFRGGVRSALGGQAAHQGRGAADGSELR
jgi:hypothetical protein